MQTLGSAIPQQDTQLSQTQWDHVQALNQASMACRVCALVCTGYKFRVRTDVSASARTEAQCYHL